MLIATFLATLGLGIIQGVLVGVILSLVLMVYRTTKPHVTALGRIPGTSHYRNISRFPQAIEAEETLIIRFDAPLFFGNANYFRESVEQYVDERGDEVSNFILDVSGMYDIDSSGMSALTEILNILIGRDIRFILAGATGPLRDHLYRAGLMEKIGDENQFLDVHDAMLATEGGVKKSRLALQTNIQKQV